MGKKKKLDGGKEDFSYYHQRISRREYQKALENPGEVMLLWIKEILLARKFKAAEKFTVARANRVCAACGGPKNHPEGSSMCKRIKINKKRGGKPVGSAKGVN